MKLTKTIFTVALLALGLNGFCTDGGKENADVSLSGNVKDMVSSETLAGVEVKLEGTEEKVFTDLDGNFKFENLTPGTYKLVFSMVSYEDEKTENVTIVHDLNGLHFKLMSK